MQTTATPTVVIRPAGASDGAAIERLARLDSARIPTGETLVAEVGGELVAALGVERGERIGDPFRRTAELLDLLALHAHEGRTHTRRTRPRRTRGATPRLRAA